MNLAEGVRRIGSGLARAALGSFAGLVVVALGLEILGRLGLVTFRDSAAGGFAYRLVVGLGAGSVAFAALVLGGKRVPARLGSVVRDAAIGTGVGVAAGVTLGASSANPKLGMSAGWTLGAALGCMIGGIHGLVIPIRPGPETRIEGRPGGPR